MASQSQYLIRNRHSNQWYGRVVIPPHIVTLILLAGLSSLSLSMFLPSLPGMSVYFETDYRVLQLSVGIYMAVNAVIQILVGPISDKVGRRPIILWGLALFVVATLGCLLAPNAEVFLFFRMGQASVVVAMVLSRAIVRDIVSQDKAASKIGYVTITGVNSACLAVIFFR